MGHLGFYLTDNKNKTIELPVAPEEIGFAFDQDANFSNVINLGEVMQVGVAKLRQIELNFILPTNLTTPSYITAQKKLKSATEYVKFVNDWQRSRKSGRIVVSDTPFNLAVEVIGFEYKFANANETEYICKLSLVEYRHIEAKKIAIRKPTIQELPKPPAQQAPARPAPPKAVAVGSTVLVNGQLHIDSYGGGPGQTERDATRIVNIIANGREFPYHVTTLEGGWRGWVRASDVVAI